MCRGIRHLKQKHPELMPEFNGTPINGIVPEVGGGESGESPGMQVEAIDEQEQ